MGLLDYLQQLKQSAPAGMGKLKEAETAGLERAAQTIAANSIANAKIKADYGLAAVQDYSQAYRRYLDQVDKQTAKFGGVKKYVSRLGDLKNNRYKV